MATRFNQIFEREQYVPMVQPLPYEALAGLGESFQKENDQLTEASFKLRELWKNKKYISEDMPYVKQMDSEYEPMLKNVSELIARQDPQARKALIEASAKISGDTRFNTLALNYETKDRAMKERAALEKEGKWAKLGWSDGFTSAANSRTELQLINYTSHSPWFAPDEDARKVMGNISSSSIKIGAEGFDYGPNGKLIIKGGYTKYGGVTSDRVTQEAQYKLDLLKRTNGGMSLERDLYQQGLTDQKDRDLYMLDYLYKTASGQISSDREEMRTIENAADKYDPKNTYSTFEDSEGINLENAGIPEAYELLPAQGTSSRDIEDALSYTGEGPLGRVAVNNLTEDQKNRMGSNKTWQSAYEKLGPKKKETVNRIIQKALPDISKKILTGKATEEDYKQVNLLAYKVGKSMSEGKVFSSYQSYDTDTRDEMTNYIFGKPNATLKDIGAGKFSDRWFYNPRTGETMSGTQFYDNEITPNMKSNPDMLIQVTGENRGTSPVSLVTGNNNFDLSRSINVGGKTYIMSSAKQEYKNGKDLKQEAARNNLYYNMQWGMPKLKDAAYEVNKYNGTTTTKEYIDGKEIGETRYNPISKEWEISLSLDGKTFFYKTDSPDSIKDAIGQFYNSTLKR